MFILSDLTCSDDLIGSIRVVDDGCGLVLLHDS